MITPRHVLIGSLVVLWGCCLWVIALTFAALKQGFDGFAIVATCTILAACILATYGVAHQHKSRDWQAEAWRKYWERKERE